MMTIIEYTSGRFSKIPVLCGPTASGKSSLALSLCLAAQGELCSCDSMQIYRHMDIGTAKPTPQEQAMVRHHLIDLVEPTDQYHVGMYVEAAQDCISDCLNRGVLPVFCGGTGQYVSALSLGIQYADITIDPNLHDSLIRMGEEQGYDVLYQELFEVDPISAAKIHPNNRKRVIRALEIYRQTGNTMSYYNQQSIQKGPAYPFALFAIHWDRDKLYQRMDDRVDLMISSGLLNEVKMIKEMGVSCKNTSLQAIGYKEMSDYLDNHITYDEAVQLIKQKTRNYGKRQLTWFRNMQGVTWIEPGQLDVILRSL
jgi:tRNA dimethylallyltransferase